MHLPSGRGRPRRLRRGKLVLVALLGGTLATCGTTLAASEPASAPASAPVVEESRTVCGSPAPGVIGTTQRTLEHRGEQRSYALHLPATYDGSRPLPVIVLLHGLGRDPRSMIAMTRMDRLADAEDVIVVAPKARGAVPAWSFSSLGGGPGADVAFVDAVLDDVTATTCTDVARTYAVGFSNGGALTMALACRPEPRFAAFASVAGPWRSSDCASAPPRSVIAFHGTKDRVVDYGGGRTRIGTLPGARAAAGAWARHDLCGPALRTRGPKVERLLWTECSDGSDVELWTIRGGGHSWPGGAAPGATVSTPARSRAGTLDATRAIWAFLSSHSLGG